MVSRKNISILGSTGSIGKSTLEVVRALDGFNIFAISGHSNLPLLAEQAQEFTNCRVVATDCELAKAYPFPEKVRGRLELGEEALVRIATDPQVDILVAAIVGSAGLSSTLAAVQAGKTVALANKEALVVAGQLVMDAARTHQSTILPVDSEHSAVFQAIQCGNRHEVEKIVLTASGGPFRDHSAESLKSVTVEQALNHPTWKMGRKISIDSATMMNKALEIIEARWLFGLQPNQIHVAIHPQSIIHSLVEFSDSSVMAQLSPPDMKLPIQYALTFPDRIPGPSPRLDFTQTINFELRPPDLEKFPALRLGYEVAEAGGTAGAVLNAANEAAVEAFLKKRISFVDIVSSCEQVLKHHQFDPNPNLDALMQSDRWARKEISKWITC